MNKYKKKGDASARVLETLKVLSTQDASIQDLIKYFQKIDPQNRIYTNEVILKYINTLKVFGYNIQKQKDKYSLLNPPPKLSLTKTELIGLKTIEELCTEFPEKEIQKNVFELTQNIKQKLCAETKINYEQIQNKCLINLKILNTKNDKVLNNLEKICKDKQKIKIAFINNQKKSETLIADPIEIKYQNLEAHLSLYEPISAQTHDINAQDIIKIEQLPLQINTNKLASSVIFKLKDRLAKAYKLKEHERLSDTDDNGNIIVINQNEDRNHLLQRLLKYGELCEVISPKDFKEKIKLEIKAILNQYN